jgi:hypothetical protein
MFPQPGFIALALLLAEPQRLDARGVELDEQAGSSTLLKKSAWSA